MLIYDLRFAARWLLKNGGFSAVATLTLALGMGANTAIFSMLDALMLKTLPVREPEQLIRLTRETPEGEEITFSYPQFEQFRQESGASSDWTAYTTIPRLAARTDDWTGIAAAELVSGNYFALLGIKSSVGRVLQSDDDAGLGASPVAVISFDFWSRRFGLDRSVLGRTLFLNRVPFTVVGVAPAGFRGMSRVSSPDIWIPVTQESLLEPGKPWLDDPDAMRLVLIARLKPGVSRQQWQVKLSPLYERMMQDLATRMPSEEQYSVLNSRLELRPGGTELSWLTRLSRPLLLAMAVVGFVLLIACFNVAGLLLARGTVRQKEVAVRLAIGASRWRIIRQLLTESLLLAVCGALAGVWLGWEGRKLALWLAPTGPLRTLLGLAPDYRVLEFTAATCVLTCLLFGLAPAVLATRVDLTRALAEGPGRIRPAFVPLGPAKLMVSAQMALSLPMLISAGLLVRTLWNLENVQPGFDLDHVVLLSVDPEPAGYKGAQLAGLNRRFLEQLRALPGIQSVSFSSESPFDCIGSPDRLVSLGSRSLPAPGREVMTESVSSGYFKTVRIPLVAGREFSASDTQGEPQAVIINKTMARLYFPQENPMGKRFGLAGKGESSLEIVGVAADCRCNGLRNDPPAVVYLAADREKLAPLTFEARAQVPPESLVGPIQARARSIDKDLPLLYLQTPRQQLFDSLLQERWVASMTGLFAALALVLACVGLYGTMAYAVGLRTREIGIRMVLGAERKRVRLLVLREVSVLLMIGACAGVPAGLLAARLMGNILFGVKPWDLGTTLGATLLLAGVGIMAGYLPARKASRVEPAEALRYE